MGAIAGCSSGPQEISIPIVDSSDAASAAIEQGDKDGDGQISKAEAVATPSLLDAFDTYDANKDGKLDEMEIETRIASWPARGPGIVSIAFDVKLDGQPLTDAKVILEPELFTGDVLPPAEAVTANGGVCGPTVSPDLLSKEVPVGLFCGLYRIKVTHPTKTIPARYNENTEIGIEIAPDFDVYNRKTYQLSTR
jgi:hypothetical protein